MMECVLLVLSFLLSRSKKKKTISVKEAVDMMGREIEDYGVLCIEM